MKVVLDCVHVIRTYINRILRGAYMIYKDAIHREYSCLLIPGPTSNLNKIRLATELLSAVLVETPIAQKPSITFDTKTIFNGVLAFMVSVFAASPGFAQEVQSGTPDFRLEEVVVTAQRREQVIMDVPISITAYTEDQIVDARIESIEDYFDTTPNIFVTAGATRNGNNVTHSSLGLALRGVSNIGGDTSSFGIYLDDFNISNGTLNPHLMDMERIEVLRGPQGTYFGRNASGGVLSINSNKPDKDFYASAGIDYGRFDTAEARGVVNVALSDKAFARIAGKWTVSDGHLENVNPSGDGNGYNHKALRASLRFLPTDDLTVDFSFNFANEHQEDVGVVHTGLVGGFVNSICFPPVVCPTDSNIGFYPANDDKFNHNDPLRVRNEYKIVNGRVVYETEMITLTSITGYLESEFYRGGDLDFSSVDFLDEPRNNEDRKTFSQEIRLQSNYDTSLSWTIGMVYARDNFDETELITFGAENGFGLPNGFAIEDRTFDQKITSWAGFGELAWEVTDRFSLIAGVRYSHDRIKRDESKSEFSSPFNFVNGKRSFDDISPRFAANFAMTDDINVYATVAKGWKSGGFQLDAFRQRSDFDEETLWNYEVGFKGMFYDDRLRANLSFFYIDWNDVQVRSGIFGITNTGAVVSFSGISNAASATSKGIELELLAAPTDGLELGFNLGYMNAEFDKFEGANTNYGTVDLSGKSLPKAPDWTVSAHGQYRFPVSGPWEAYLRAEYSYTDETFNNVNNIAAVIAGLDPFPFLADSFDTLNLRAGIETDKYRLTVFVENVFDSDHFTSSYDFGFVNGAAVYPVYRMWGIQASVKFY